MQRFDRFTDAARKALTLAQDEASRPCIGTEHLLLGLIRLPDCVAGRALESMGAPLSDVQRAVEHSVGKDDRPVCGEVGLTERAKRVIELAIEEARQMGAGDFTTGHLLLGLLGEGEGIAASVLHAFSIDLDTAREQVRRILAAGDASEDAGGNVAPLVAVGTLPPEEARRFQEQWGRFAGLTAGALDRVVTIGQTASDAGVRLELLALEVRAAGCVLHWRAHTAARLVVRPEFVVRDDAATDYTVRPAGSSGSLGDQQGQALIVPAPPGAAHTMRIEVHAFGARRMPLPPGVPPPPTEEIHGAWRFEFSMRERR